MKKNYNSPKAEIVTVMSEDIITLSLNVGIFDIGDGDSVDFSDLVS